MTQAVHLTDRDPRVNRDELLADFVPPPQFEGVSFDSYQPDPAQPSQSQARDSLQFFAQAGRGGGGLFKKLFGKADKAAEKGIYLDGGYGVGKTHLLASAWHASEKPAAFGTFVEYTNLIGALGFPTAKAELEKMKLVCIDEFELDDPGDTVMMSRLMRELTDAGTKIVATSNTLPGALGQGRFAAQDFLREIQALSDQFNVLRIDGDDYRHREITEPPEPLGAEELASAEEKVLSDGRVLATDEFPELVEHLQRIHPSKYRRLIDGVQFASWRQVEPIGNEGVALRFVALVDRLYDADIGIVNSGIRLDKIFSDEMLGGGYRKKYMRCLSRMTALSSKSVDGAEESAA